MPLPGVGSKVLGGLVAAGLVGGIAAERLTRADTRTEGSFPSSHPHSKAFDATMLGATGALLGGGVLASMMSVNGRAAELGQAALVGTALIGTAVMMGAGVSDRL